MSLARPPELDLEVHEDPCLHVYFDSTGAKTVLQFAVVLHGLILINPSGSVAAVMSIYDGADTSGNPDFPYGLASSESISDNYGPRGVLFRNGVTVNVTAGEVKGSLLYRRYWGR